MSKLLLVRHGETELNSGERFWGRTDVELGAVGVGQVERLRDRLVAERIDAIYSSDLRRALATAQIIASGQQLAVRACAELREIDFGKVEGLTFDEIIQRYPEIAEWKVNWGLETRFPGGESVAELNARVSNFLDRLDKHTPGQTILIVAHSASLRVLICQLLGVDVRHWRQFRLSLASLSVLETFAHGTILMSLNDTCHLRC